MTPSPGIEPGPHWWKASDLPLRQPCSPAKLQYASRLQEGVGLLPSLDVSASDVSSTSDQTNKEGWALKEAKKAERFNETQRSYLEAKFNIGQATGRKLDAEVVAKEMRRARGADGDRLFSVTEFLSPLQVASFFSRLAAKLRQQEVQVTEQDVLAAEEQVRTFLQQETRCYRPCISAIPLLLNSMTCVLW